MPNKRKRYATSMLREAGALPYLRTAWSPPTGEHPGLPFAPEAPHPCAGGCGQMVTSVKCSDSAARAVGDWLRGGTATQAAIAARYYRA
jgi:hypothetical protein